MTAENKFFNIGVGNPLPERYPWTGEVRGVHVYRKIGDSFTHNADYFVIHYDENNKPNYWQANGREVTKDEFDLLTGGPFRAKA
jgi:hypothetical protein